MNLPFYIAGRLSLGSGGKRMSPAVTVAIVAIAISVAVMIASIAIVLGFKNEIRDKVVGFNGHISLFRVPASEEDNNIIQANSFATNVLDQLPFVKEYVIQSSIPAIFKTSEDFKGIYIRGLQGENATKYIENNLEEGYIPDYSDENEKNKIVISRIAANQLRLKAGDKIETYFFSNNIKVRKLEIAGIYNSHFDQYDDVIMFGAMPLVTQMGDLPDNSGTYIMLQTDNFDKIPEYTQELQYIFNQAVSNGDTNNYYRTDNVLSQGRGFFSWLSLLDTNVVVIITLMMIVGCVTLVSGMLIIILERKKFIGLMRALGANTTTIRNVFILMALKIAVIGIAIGDILILILLYFQQKYHFLKLDAESYYIDFVPVYLPGWIVVALNVGVLFVTYLVLVLPSRFVGKISPAETLLGED